MSEANGGQLIHLFKLLHFSTVTVWIDVVSIMAESKNREDWDTVKKRAGRRGLRVRENKLGIAWDKEWIETESVSSGFSKWRLITIRHLVVELKTYCTLETANLVLANLHEREALFYRSPSAEYHFKMFNTFVFTDFEEYKNVFPENLFRILKK